MGYAGWLVRALMLAIVGVSAVDVGAQMRCTMPNGVKITQQLGDCPRGAVAAEKLDGTPVPLVEPNAPKVAQPQTAQQKSDALRQSVQANDAAQSSGVGGIRLFSWIVTGVFLFGLVKLVKGSIGGSGPVRYCSSCGHEGRGKTATRGHLLIEIILWICFLIPGLIYSIWRHSSRYKVCTSCGSNTLVPPNSPVALAAKRSMAQ